MKSPISFRLKEEALKLNDFLLVRVQNENLTPYKRFICQTKTDEEYQEIKCIWRLELGNFRFPDIYDTPFIDISELIKILKPKYAKRYIYNFGKISVG